MQMPNMNGAAFLTEVRKRCSDVSRVLLTAQADIESACAAVNRGQTFRFLTKPCPPEELRAALNDAVAQHRLITSERVLLEQTLVGSVRALSEVLALVHPGLPVHVTPPRGGCCGRRDPNPAGPWRSLCH